jgi:starch-binding outer membrane protein, SusD/RagB family
MKRFKILYILLFGWVFLLTSCLQDLNREPIDPSVSTANIVFDNEEAYLQALAKIYASYALSGQQGGGGGNPDISGIDEGFGNYLRQYWGLQELSTDEAIIAWDDATIKNFHWQTWAPNDVFITALYSRIFYSVSLANEFVRQSNDPYDGASDAFLITLQQYQAEARFLRAFSYFHAIDMFGNVPFITEADAPGVFYPEQIQRAALFDYIESELLDIQDKLGEPGFSYGHADQGACWMLLAKLYLNAEVYTGTERYTDALTYTKKVIDAGYTLDPYYGDVFTADNNTSPEIIFPICFDGQNTQQYGGMTFVMHASNGGGMPLYGIDGGWGGIRTIQNFVTGYFGLTEGSFSPADPTASACPDKRAMFFFNTDEGWQWDITNVGTFTHGIGITKFRNVIYPDRVNFPDSTLPAPNAHSTFVSVDFPVYRLADAYLMYAECVLRGASGGDAGTALGYVNQLRERAYDGPSGDIEAGDLTLDFILSERARELYWECHRRTDLIRFGKFTGGDYIWEWKGNVQAGQSTPQYRDLYPIPSNDLNANPNLVQNTGY